MTPTRIIYVPNQDAPQRIALECGLCDQPFAKVDLSQVTAEQVVAAQEVLWALRHSCPKVLSGVVVAERGAQIAGVVHGGMFMNR